MASESHAQMRELPPLTDNLDDEESGVVEDQDRYLIKSKTSEDNSVSRTKKSIPTIDAKKSTYRRSGLAAFRPKSQQDSLTKNKTYETISTTGSSSSSQATTTVTGHTRKTIAFLRSPRQSKIRTLSKSSTKGNGTKRFAALKARVRVRKV